MANHKNFKRLPGVTRAVTFALATAFVFQAFPVKAADNGKTEVNLGVTEETKASVSYEVPLYCTLAVVEGKDGTKVVTPSEDRYYIKDTGNNQGKKLAVTGLTVSSIGTTPGEIKVTGAGTWNLTTAAGTETAKETEKLMQLSVGGVELKSINPGTWDVTTLDLKENENVFYDKTANRYKTMKNKIKIPIKATVSKQYKVQKATTSPIAVAQFRLHYTVSVLDENGELKDNWHYIGPDATGKDVDLVGGIK